MVEWLRGRETAKVEEKCPPTEGLDYRMLGASSIIYRYEMCKMRPSPACSAHPPAHSPQLLASQMPMTPLELREENDRRRTLGMPLLDEEDGLSRKEAKRRRREVRLFSEMITSCGSGEREGGTLCPARIMLLQAFCAFAGVLP